MPKVGETTLKGQSGKEYTLNAYTGDMEFNDFIPGVYVISAVQDGAEKYLYIGETDNIHPLLKAHPEQAKFDAANYNRISFYKNASREVRTAIMDDLKPVLKLA
jgi:hypothetical protein